MEKEGQLIKVSHSLQTSARGRPIRNSDYLVQEEILLGQNLTYRIDAIPNPTINPINGKTQYIIYMSEL
ncbi:MAG: hypothetical protein ACI9N1_002089 [Flavobacteriales bacterium]|jgi:hypothetical protein